MFFNSMNLDLTNRGRHFGSRFQGFVGAKRFAFFPTLLCFPTLCVSGYSGFTDTLRYEENTFQSICSTISRSFRSLSLVIEHYSLGVNFQQKFVHKTFVAVFSQTCNEKPKVENMFGLCAFNAAVTHCFVEQVVSSCVACKLTYETK